MRLRPTFSRAVLRWFGDMTKISCGGELPVRDAATADGNFTARLFFGDRKQCGDHASDATTVPSAFGRNGESREGHDADDVPRDRQAAPRGDNGSVFFSRLPLRAKSAMAEILVSDLCDCRPPLLIGGLFSFSPDSRAAPSPCLPASNRTVSTCPDFPTVPIALRIAFFIVRHCSCASGISAACAKPCIVIGAHFPL